jgi:putative endonuclease
VEFYNLSFTSSSGGVAAMPDRHSNQPSKKVAGASPTMPFWRRWFGTRSEQAAERYVKSLGFRIIARNYSCSHGELDIVAVDGECLVFIEVRSTERDDVSRPAASVDVAKQRRLTKLALHYLQHHQLLGRPVRFDVLALSWPPNQTAPHVDHYANAFEASEPLASFF